MVIDPDYRGDYIVPLHNDTDETQIIRKGDRVAQLVLLDFNHMDFEVVDSLDETERNDGGFGHSGQ